MCWDRTVVLWGNRCQWSKAVEKLWCIYRVLHPPCPNFPNAPFPFPAVCFYYLIPGWNSCSPSGLSGTRGSEQLTARYPPTFPWDRDVHWANWGTEAVGTHEGMQVIQTKPSRKLQLTSSNRKVWGWKLPSQVWWELVYILLAVGRKSGTGWQSDGQWLPKIPQFWVFPHSSASVLCLVFPTFILCLRIFF